MAGFYRLYDCLTHQGDWTLGREQKMFLLLLLFLQYLGWCLICKWYLINIKWMNNGNRIPPSPHPPAPTQRISCLKYITPMQQCWEEQRASQQSPVWTKSKKKSGWGRCSSSSQHRTQRPQYNPLSDRQGMMRV